MAQRRKNRGGISIPAGMSIWPHELRTARALARAGYSVEFLRQQQAKHAKSPDILMDKVKWEIKSPTARRLPAIERNLKRAYHQSTNIVFDSHRMRYLPDKSIQKELIKQYVLTKNIKRMIFVNRKHEVIDISILP